MADVLLKHNDYGDFESLYYLLFDVLDFNGPRLTKDVKNYSRERSTRLSFSIDAALDILCFIDWIEINGELTRPTGVKRFYLYREDKELIKESLIKAIISKLKTKGLLQSLFRLDSYKYDVFDDVITLKSNLIPLEYSGLRNLFFELSFFEEYLSSTLIQINSNYTTFFINEIALWIKEQLLKDIPTYALSYEQFLQIQDIKNNHGEEAEEFVLKFEQFRLINHPDHEKIKIISDIDVGAGFDIISFNDENSRTYDRFIEVKSFSENLRFYWSRNEVRVAEIKGGRYYLYLVNRDKMDDEDYSPTIINNPYQSVFMDKSWSKKSEVWKVESLSE